MAFTAGDETLGFLGASGCGKSLTMRCIAGIETPDEGRIVVNDQVDVYKRQLHARRGGARAARHGPREQGRRAHPPRAVSYTHLDVYKRQARESGGEAKR